MCVRVRVRVCVCVCVCVCVSITRKHLCAVLQYLGSEGLPGPCQLAEETPYVCELAARGPEHGESRSQGLPLPHTHSSDTHKHTAFHYCNLN